MNQESQHSNGQYDEQMNRLFANWMVFDEDIQVVKRREFRGIWEDIGEQRFTAAVTAIINEGHYKLFPIVSEFRAYVPIGKREYCGKCERGWIMVPDLEADRIYRVGPEAPPWKHHQMAARCECRRTA